MSLSPTFTYDVVIIGGGLAGLMASAQAEARGASALLIDCAVPGTPSVLGGFASFSGAKFSLAPAGSGIAAVLGGMSHLVSAYAGVCAEFVDLGFPQFRATERQLVGEETVRGGGLDYRRYHSILLKPEEVSSLLARLSARLRKTRVVKSEAIGIEVQHGSPFAVQLACGAAVVGRSIIVASGRLGSGLLCAAGIPETRGKGIDVGLRLEFATPEPLAGLRSYGPDAKFMSGSTRTFCLNSPGRIFHYAGLGYSIPGGIVATPGTSASNVGVLVRLEDRRAVLSHLARHTPHEGTPPMSQRGSGTDLAWSTASRSLLTEAVAAEVDDFIGRLAEVGLVRLPKSYDVHYPLLDWYWPVFSLDDRLMTGVPGVIAAGDASGHARGLMQAALMGKLAVEEALT